jgi:hypothetical protein
MFLPTVFRGRRLLSRYLGAALAVVAFHRVRPSGLAAR